MLGIRYIEIYHSDVMSMEFAPTKMTLLDGTLLIVEKVPATTAAAQGFLKLERQGYVAAYAQTRGHTREGRQCVITAEDAASIFSPESPDQVDEIIAIAAGRYATELDITLLQATITQDDGEHVAGVLNFMQGDICCKHPEGGEAYGAKIHELHVDPKFRRRLVAAAMVTTVVNAITHTDDNEAQLMLRCGVHNHTAKNCYEGWGIRRTGHNMDDNWPNGLRVPAEERAVGVAALNAYMQSQYGRRLITIPQA